MKRFNGLTALTLLMLMMLIPSAYFNKAFAQGSGNFPSVIFGKDKGGCDELGGSGFIPDSQTYKLTLKGDNTQANSSNYITRCVTNPITLSGGS